MLMQGCQGKPQITIKEKICPQCGNEIEIFSIDSEAVCDKCGFTIYNDAVTCAEWCKYARLCLGEETYRNMKKAAEHRKEMEAKR